MQASNMAIASTARCDLREKQSAGSSEFDWKGRML
jgi:hypothetical protein